MRTDADVANLALAVVGGRARISSLDEASQEARLCAAFYGPTRDGELRRFPWPFARTRLSRVDPDPEADPPVVGNIHPDALPTGEPWQVRLTIPANCLAVRYTLHADGSRSRRFAIEPALDGSGLTLLLEDPDCVAFYTARIVDPALWDAQFVEVVAYKLAGLVALPLTGDGRLVDRAAALYERALSSAWATAATELGPDRDEPTAEWLRARA